eukprot:3523291-Amphidinium_carterae.1
MRMGPLATIPNSSTARRGRCESRKATTVRSTRKWRERWAIWANRRKPLRSGAPGSGENAA